MPTRKATMVARSIGYGAPRYVTETLASLEIAAADTSLPAWYRVVLLARARANLWQHAPFGQGELAKLLDVHRMTLYRAIRAAIGKGHLAPGSTARCVALNRARYLRGFAPIVQCTEPRHEGIRNQEWHSGYGKWGWWDSEPARVREQREEQATMVRRAASLAAERIG